MRAANLALKFLLELAALAGLAVWGWHAGHSATRIVLAVAAPVAMGVVWGLFAAPRSARRVPIGWRVPLELGIFVLSAAALRASGHPELAVVFLLVVAMNVLGLTAFRQWES
jgi:hypothetical protein